MSHHVEFFVVEDYHIIFTLKNMYLNQTWCLPYTSSHQPIKPYKVHDVSRLEMIGYALTNYSPPSPFSIARTGCNVFAFQSFSIPVWVHVT